MHGGIRGGTLEAVCVIRAKGAAENAHTCGDVNKYVGIHHEVNLILSVHTLCGIPGSGPVACHSKNNISSQQNSQRQPTDSELIWVFFTLF